MASPPIGSRQWIEEYGLSSRVVCRQAQLEIARGDPRVFSLEGDLALPAVPFDRELPDRFLQLGIAEADLVGTAVGMALRGKIPFVNSFAAFLSMRACEQVRLDVAYHRANVKLVGYYCGLTGGWAGSTHHSTEDLAILRAMPNLTVVVPADSVATYLATWAAAEHEGPVYLRLGRAETPQVYGEGCDFVLGRAIELASGRDLTLIAAGNRMVWEALEAARILGREGLLARVLDLHTVKPIDREAVVAAARETGAIVTVEDHNVLGGLGGAVAEVVMEAAPVPIERVGVPDCFCAEVDDFERMLGTYGMDAPAIAAAGRRALARRVPGLAEPRCLAATEVPP
jgi:transketolase